MEAASFDWTLYWFMFPVAICVATSAMLSGIGGAAIFAPIFMIVFPLLGPEYPFSSFAAAIGAALFTTTFGFTSGFIGYFHKRLIDFRSAVPFILVGVPVGIVGAVMLTSLKEYEEPLRAIYGVLMLVMAAVLIRRQHGAAEQEGTPPFGAVGTGMAREIRRIVGKDGTEYVFAVPRQGKGAVVTGLGAFLTGLLGVGIGEAVMPQLAKRNKVPIAVAAATSVFVAITVVAVASSTQISLLVAQGGLQAVPWNVLVYTIPGVIIGGQIGPRLQGRISQRKMEITIGSLFAAIGIAMSYIAIRNSYLP